MRQKMPETVPNSKTDKASAKPKKGKGGVLHMKIADTFRHNIAKSGLPRPFDDLRVYESDSKENKTIFSLDERNVAKERNLAYVTNAMVAYRRNFLEFNPLYCDWTYSDLRDCAKLWFAETICEPKPKPFAFKEDNSICFHRLDFHIDISLKIHTEIMETPLWDELIGRFSNAEAVMAFIASIIIEDSYLQQYLYIFGEGGDGKGTLVRALKRLMGAAAYMKQRGPRPDDKHYGVSFANKRLVAFTDSRDPAVVRADYVMALTGDDGLEVEPKGGHGFNIEPYCKLIFLSNLEPRLANQLSEIRRIIFAKVSPRPCGPDGLVVDDPAGYEEGLWAEMEGILKKCLNVYHRLCPSHGMIPQSLEARKDIAKMTEGKETDNFQEFFDDNFALDLPEGGERWDSKRWVTVPSFNEKLRREWKQPHQRTAFKRWLAVTYGIITKGGGHKKRFSDTTDRVHYGLYVV